jgi:hypothetical protein
MSSDGRAMPHRHCVQESRPRSLPAQRSPLQAEPLPHTPSVNASTTGGCVRKVSVVIGGTLLRSG